MESFTEEFSGLAPKVRFLPEESEEGDLPAILAGTSILWRGVPGGRELTPFLRALEMLVSPAEAKASVPEAVAAKIAGVTLPADIKIYVSPQCPFCPGVVSAIVPLALLNPLLHLTVIDGALFQDLAAEDGVRSVPTVILDGVLRWGGAGNRDEIVDALLNRDPVGLGAKSLEVFLKDGNAEALAQLMIDRGQVFPAFADLVQHPHWPVRLGAMVVVEEIAEKSPDLLERVLDVLWDRLPGITGPARGDVLYLFGLGRPGSKHWIERLDGLIEKETGDAREVLMEALEKLGRGQG